MKKYAFIFCILLFHPFNAAADIIFFKDGMKTVCQEKAWEEADEVRCEYAGAILSYQKKDVVRIEKTSIEDPPESADDTTEMPGEAAAEQTAPAADIKQPATSVKEPLDQEASQTISQKSDFSKTKGLEFYNPRRPQKYWTSETSKHHNFKEAVAALAKQYDRSPEWIQNHMGDTNDLYEIHQNLSRGKLAAPAVAAQNDEEKVPETLFYNPRRPQKYWTSTSAKHNTFNEAITAMAKEYDRTPQWVQQYMGTTNNLSEIRQNLTNQKQIETSQ